MITIFFAIACVTPQRVERSQTRTTLGTAYLSEGNPSDAIKALEEATKLDPRNAEAWEKLGLAYSAKGASALAEKSFQKAIRYNPEKAEFRNNYGLLLMSQGRWDDAIVQFEIGLEDLSYRNTALILNNLGQAHYQNHSYEQSIQVLTQAINRAPNMCQARFNRGLSYNSLSKPDLALSDFLQVITLCGDVATGAYYQAGQIMIATGDVPGGCSYLQTTIRDAGTAPLGVQAQIKFNSLCQ